LSPYRVDIISDIEKQFTNLALFLDKIFPVNKKNNGFVINDKTKINPILYIFSIDPIVEYALTLVAKIVDKITVCEYSFSPSE
jgi:hypothetical protein